MTSASALFIGKCLRAVLPDEEQALAQRGILQHQPLQAHEHMLCGVLKGK